MDSQSTEQRVTPLETVRYDANTGLVPVVVQDENSGTVLMVAYANREALKRTLGTGQAWFWSRSRGEYWHKGATSGNVQHVTEMRVDCDGDSVLYLVNPEGPACHTGEYSCFYRSIVRKDSRIGEGTDVEEVNGTAVYTELDVSNDAVAQGESTTRVTAETGSETESLTDTIGHLWDVLTERWEHRPQGSYTTYLFEHGVDKVGKKVGEEAVEVVIAAKNAVHTGEGKCELAEESADLLYHVLALWKAAGISPEDVCRVLKEREK